MAEEQVSFRHPRVAPVEEATVLALAGSWLGGRLPATLLLTGPTSDGYAIVSAAVPTRKYLRE